MISSDRLYDLCYEARNHANTTPFKEGSNYWMRAFSGYLKEQLDKDYTAIRKNIKDLSHLIDFEDGYEE